MMSKQDMIQEGQTQLDDRNNYQPLKLSVVKETQKRVQNIISELHREEHIDDMTKEWLSETPNPPRILVF